MCKSIEISDDWDYQAPVQAGAAKLALKQSIDFNSQPWDCSSDGTSALSDGMFVSQLSEASEFLLDWLSGLDRPRALPLPFPLPVEKANTCQRITRT